MDDKKYKCEICNLDFDKFQQKANHDRWNHKEIPFSAEAIQSIKDKKLVRDNLKYGIFINEIDHCFKCGKDVPITYREKKGKKEKYYCSRYCANIRDHTEECKNKIGSTLSKTLRYKWANDEDYRNNQIKILNSRISFSSKSERALVQYFKENFIDDEWTNGGIIKYNDIVTSRDLYSKKLKINIEVDGIWYFKDIHGQLKDKQIKDLALNNWSTDNNWRILRIKEDFLNTKHIKKYYDLIIDFVYKQTTKYLEIYDPCF